MSWFDLTREFRFVHCFCSYTGIDVPSADSCEACRVPGLEHVLATGTYQVKNERKKKQVFDMLFVYTVTDTDPIGPRIQMRNKKPDMAPKQV